MRSMDNIGENELKTLLFGRHKSFKRTTEEARIKLLKCIFGHSNRFHCTERFLLCN